MLKQNQEKKFNIFFCCSKEISKTKIKNLQNKTENSLKFLGKKRFCTCNKSKCNKKYCDCFSKGEKCNENFCSCIDCKNKMNLNNNYQLKFGICCSCQKSECSKKYCECYNNGKKCNICCSCMDCKNKKDINIKGDNFFSADSLKKIYIKNESIIIDNYKLNV